MDVEYTRKEKKLLQYIASGYSMYRPHLHPSIIRDKRRKEMEKEEQTPRRTYSYGGEKVSREWYLLNYLRNVEAMDDRWTEDEIKRAKEWEQSHWNQIKRSKDEEYGEFVKTSASETFKLIIFLILLGLGLVFWPLLIVAFISGGFFFGGERFLK